VKRLIFDTDVKAIRDEKLRGNYPNIHCENDLIDAVPTADLSELWIPVTERLPEIYKTVLVYRENLSVSGGYMSLEFLTTGFGYTPQWSNDLQTWKSKVTHWMPLPEPPKKEAENT
jgi:hypothetical protein